MARVTPNSPDEEILRWYNTHPSSDKWLRENRMRRVSNLCKLVKEGEIVLDVGCGSGTHLATLAEREIKGYGMTASRPEYEEARRLYPSIPVKHLLFEDYRIPWDVTTVMFADSLEHLRDLDAVFRRIDYIPNIVACIPTADLKEGEKYGHLHKFTPRSIRKLFDKHGFKVTTFYKDEGWYFVRAEKKVPLFKKIISYVVSNAPTLVLKSNP